LLLLLLLSSTGWF